MPVFEPSLPGLEVHSLETFNGSSVADLEIEVIAGIDGWKCDLRFRTELYEHAYSITFARPLRNSSRVDRARRPTGRLAAFSCSRQPSGSRFWLISTASYASGQNHGEYMS